MNMKSIPVYLLTFCCALIAGCTRHVRPISNSAYHPEAPRHGIYCGPETNRVESQYQGELSEFDVLGITRGHTTSENEIRRALEQAGSVRLRPNSTILLIQSGAVFPDGLMIEELEKYFRVVPFSGVPGEATTSRLEYGSSNPESYAKSLRLAAARGGNKSIVCYWGVLESENENLPIKTISWAPGFNWLVPDETEHMRIKLKFAVIDVASGTWTIFSPKQFELARSTRSPRRAVVDQKMVESLKKKAYKAGVSELLRLHTEIAQGN